MSDFKKEAAAVERNLEALIHELDKIAQNEAEWTRPVFVPIDIDAAVAKIKVDLKKEAMLLPGSCKGILKSVFKQVDPADGSTGVEPCQK